MPIDLSGMPPELSNRIALESAENDELYRRWDRERLSLDRMHYGQAYMLSWALSKLQPLKQSRILDIGVGQGYSSTLLCREGAQVTGIDISQEGLRLASNLASQYGFSPKFQQMAGEDLRFPDESFDGILCISAYHHMDLDKASKEFARVLRPGGRVVLIEPLASNPPACVYRKLVRAADRGATSEEIPLRVRDLASLRRNFKRVKWQGLFLVGLAPISIDRLWKNNNALVHRLTRHLFAATLPIDRVLARVPGLDRLAWKIGIVAEK